MSKHKNKNKASVTSKMSKEVSQIDPPLSADNTQNQEKSQKETSLLAGLPFIPVILVLGYLPVLVRTVSYRTYLENYEWFSSANATLVDVFLKCKAVFFVAVSAAMLLIMVSWLVRGKAEIFLKLKKLPFAFVAGMALLVIISGIRAENKPLLLHGGFENFESIFVTLSYLVAMIYAYLLFSMEEGLKGGLSLYPEGGRPENFGKDLVFVYRMSLPGFLYVALIGLFQIFGLDLFKTDIGKKLFTSAEYLESLDSITVGTGEYATLHNIDYVSVFFGMWVFILLALLLMSKTMPERLVRGALLLISITDMFGAKSDGGRLGFVVAAALGILMLLADQKKRFLIFLGTLAGAVVIVLAIPSARDRIFLGNVSPAGSDMEDYRITHIAPADNGVYFDLDGWEFLLSYRYENDVLKLDLKDMDGGPIEGIYHEGGGDGFQYYDFKPDEMPAGAVVSEFYFRESEDLEPVRSVIFGCRGDNISVGISNEADGSGDYFFVNPMGKFSRNDGTEIANAGVFPDNLFSGRGKIWNKTLPILKDYIFAGCGSGLFITAFPQNNYLDRLFASAGYDVKPHSLYLQYWVEEGLLFLILFLALMGAYYAGVVRLLKKRAGADCPVPLACACAVTVFLVAGLACDSMIVYSPFFWILLGIGFAANEAEGRG